VSLHSPSLDQTLLIPEFPRVFTYNHIPPSCKIEHLSLFLLLSDFPTPPVSPLRCISLCFCSDSMHYLASLSNVSYPVPVAFVSLCLMVSAGIQGTFPPTKTDQARVPPLGCSDRTFHLDRNLSRGEQMEDFSSPGLASPPISHLPTTHTTG